MTVRNAISCYGGVQKHRQTNIHSCTCTNASTHIHIRTHTHEQAYAYTHNIHILVCVCINICSRISSSAIRRCNILMEIKDTASASIKRLAELCGRGITVDLLTINKCQHCSYCPQYIVILLCPPWGVCRYASFFISYFQ